MSHRSHLVSIALILFACGVGPLFLLACRDAGPAAPSSPADAAGQSDSSTGAKAALSDRGEASGGPTTKEACAELLRQTESEFVAAYEKSDRRCNAADDCVAGKWACRAGCNWHSVAKRGEKALNNATSALTERCSDVWKPPCTTLNPLPIPSCPIYVPKCVAGKCTTEISTGK